MMDYLAEERKKAEFDVEVMKIAWAGSEHAFRTNDRISRLVANDPEFSNHGKMTLTRKDLLKSTLRKSAHAWKIINELRLTEEEATKLRFYVDQPGYTDLHWYMFIPAIKGQGTEEQQKKWLPLAYKMQIIGTYAQTELGHGSNVQGLETTATFDPLTDEFVIHSPTLTSSKWWPGGVGKVSTHAIVYARLISMGKDHGVKGFMVQLRSLKDHSLLPGITAGDIGTKFGNAAYNGMDNGVLQFDHVRIPRDHMMMRLSQITKEGHVLSSSAPKQLQYGTMVYVRKVIVLDASVALSRATCIATRYSAIRRQFGSQGGGPESQVIDYKTQQSRLFPLLASAYAFRFVGEWLNWLYGDVTERLQAGDFSTLPETHACTSGLKSVITTATSYGIDECRKLCGGHGYLCSSGLPDLYAVYVPACNYEGDNVVLLLQVARFLMKTINQLGESEKLPVGTTISYMKRAHQLLHSTSDVHIAEDWLKPSSILQAFEARAMKMSVRCAQNISNSPTPELGFSELSADLIEAAKAHCQLIIVSKFIDKVQKDTTIKSGVKEYLCILCNVYALSTLQKHLGDFLSVECITPQQGALANEQLRHLYRQVRPNAVALVDAFNYTDHFLGSALGRYDGNVYQTLYNEAWKDPLNDSEIPDGYEEYIQPLLKQSFKYSRM
ncbi:Acyl-CoA oxidase [Zostera marina]|uniref:Acyl-coenzyme A oxidase n=1 Tax=Zostera marina TaxID=29655 RepID=A0A0K9P259_ZOSMR|nr:Acyl-CoA oxidase [Zostera marina]